MYTKENVIKVLVIDDHQIFIDGIYALFSEDESIRIIGSCHSGEKAAGLITNFSPDIVLLDINLFNCDGVALCKNLILLFPDLKIIALSMHNEGSFIKGMIKNGAKGYVLKNSGKEILKEAIHSVYKGSNYFSKEVSEIVLKSIMPSRSEDRNTKLTRREKEILNLIIFEYTTQEIAEKLFISLNTVETHRKHLIQKLGVKNTAGMVRKAIELGLTNS